jgi:putative radical SAM enzyme (TIGR03279 family)
MKGSGVEIEEVVPGSSCASAGLLTGDRLISINGHRIRDSIDLLYYGNEPDLDIQIAHSDEARHVEVILEGGASGLGIVLKPFKIKKCTNRCIFCFVNQLPKGMRKPLYVKDEDYRLSFLYGNYVTLTSLTNDERKRIVAQRLSPLYISVHSTDTEVRNLMLGNPKAGDILKELRFFAEHNIRMHAQIVLCPGYNDGRELARTINDLYKFHPYVESIAVVPVGLTAHRKKVLRPVEKSDALNALETIHRYQFRFKRKHGEHIVFAADEFYIKAGIELPPLGNYDELSQIENGVGLVPQFLSQAKRVKIQLPEKLKKKKFITFTGISFFPFLLRFVERLRRKGLDIEVVPVENVYFGSSITVAGLLTGRDVMRALSEHTHSDNILLIPDIVMKEGHEVFLDDVSRQDVEEILGIKSVIIESTPSGLLGAVLQLMKITPPSPS